MRSSSLDPLLLVAAHQDDRLETVREQRGANGEALAALRARVAALAREGDIELATGIRTVPLPHVSPVPVREFGELLAEARLIYPQVRHPARLLSPALHAAALERHQELKAVVRQGRTLNVTEAAVAGLAGLLSALVSAVLVDVPRHSGWLGGEAEEGGPLARWVRKRMDAAIPDEVRRSWESAYRVPYDAPHSAGLGHPVEGLSPNTHRFQSLGHDPLLGLIFGMRDLMRGEFTAVSATGRVVVNQVGPGVGFWEALIAFVMHLASDLTTTRGLPVPLMPLLQFVQAGHFGPHGYTVAQLARQMYRQGYDLRHMVAMSLPVLLTEVLVRTFYLFEQLRAGRTLREAIPFGSRPRLQRMLLIAHGVAAAGNAGKVVLTRNPLAINAPQWVALARYALPEAAWQCWGKSREVQRLIDEDFEVLHVLYQREQEQQAAFRL